MLRLFGTPSTPLGQKDAGNRDWSTVQPDQEADCEICNNPTYAEINTVAAHMLHQVYDY